MYKNFFITGYPGSGKTTIFNDIVAVPNIIIDEKGFLIFWWLGVKRV
jgi:nucleoside-triphosphatase THEP1